MKTITFIRHGESTANAGGITMAQEDIPLSALGEQQAQAIALLLPNDPALILTSAFLRTQLTAKPYCSRTGLAAKANPLLNEFSAIDPALIVGMNGTQRKPFMDEFWRIPSLHKRMGNQADTFNEFALRVMAFAKSMDSLPDNTVVFSHGIWMGLLAWWAIGFECCNDEDMKSFRRFQIGLPMPNCAVYQVIHHGTGAWQIQAHQAMTHINHAPKPF